jgi:hypothetical protein
VGRRKLKGKGRSRKGRKGRMEQEREEGRREDIKGRREERGRRLERREDGNILGKDIEGRIQHEVSQIRDHGVGVARASFFYSVRGSQHQNTNGCRS